MDLVKESTIELQKIDCNCNDCKFMQRNNAKFNTHRAHDYNYQYWFWRRKRARAIWAAREKIARDKERGGIAMQMALSMEFNYIPQIVSECYGYCVQFKKDVSFLPNALQLHTQNCFQHRREL